MEGGWLGVHECLRAEFGVYFRFGRGFGFCSRYLQCARDFVKIARNVPIVDKITGTRVGAKKIPGA